jgi:hypothetical protein
MKRLTAVLTAVATLASIAAFTARAPRYAAAQQAAAIVTEIRIPRLDADLRGP